MKRVVFSLGGYDLQACKLLQHGLSLLGLTALVWSGLRWLRRAPAATEAEVRPALPRAARRVLWAVLALVPVATAATVFGLYLGRMSFRRAFGHGLVAAIGALGLELLILGLIWRLAPRLPHRG